jgi:hypothetical protein
MGKSGLGRLLSAAVALAGAPSAALGRAPNKRVVRPTGTTGAGGAAEAACVATAPVDDDSGAGVAADAPFFCCWLPDGWLRFGGIFGTTCSKDFDSAGKSLQHEANNKKR